MAFDTLVVNGRVVTATDTYSSDVAISGGKIEAIGKNLPRDNTKKVIIGSLAEASTTRV